jgi:RecJ-like exonuclease
MNDEGDEITVALPHRMEVCERCEGHGKHLNPNIGSHAYTPEEFNESFDDDEREQYFKRGGIYDVICEVCHGRNVVPMLDESACKVQGLTTEMEAYLKSEKERCQYEAECRAEQRMESGMLGEW